MAEPQKILVIQLKRAGDVLVTTPVLPALRERFPNARIDFLVEPAFAPVLEHNPYVNEIQLYRRGDVLGTLRRIRAQRYDWVLDFLSSPRSAVVTLTSGAAVRGGYRVPFWGRVYNHAVPRPRGSQSVIAGKFTLLEPLIGRATATERKMYLTQEDRAWAQNVANSPAPGKATVGLIPTHRRSSRRWHAESFTALARKLIAEGHNVWLFWGPGEEAYVEAIRRSAPGARMIPPTSLRQMAALLERCDVVATNDNGPMHTAVAVGTPTVTVYGPTDPVCWNPGGPNHRILQATDVPCLGCNLNECPFAHECMTHVTVDRFFQECLQLASARIAVGRL